VLGAGLDTRAVRKSSAGVTYFEIDDAATLELKRARLAEHGMPGDTHFIAGNL
jgi:O-methyltransferase involved in polyketide biosynthesis